MPDTELSLTDAEKDIYNEFLKYSRTGIGKPFRYRKNFDDMTSEQTVALHRIATLFKKFPHINHEQYFIAPYKIYTDQPYKDLTFYSTPAALHAYKTYNKLLLEQSPDSEDCIDGIKKSLAFIAKFCMERGISFQEYLKYRSASTIDWMVHLKSNLINPYLTVEIPGIDSIIFSVPEDERYFLIDDFSNKMLDFRYKLSKSTKARAMIKEGLSRLTQLLQNQPNPK